MSPAYIKGVEAQFPDAAITFDKFHVLAHASHALDLSRAATNKSAVPISRDCDGPCSTIETGSATAAATTSMPYWRISRPIDQRAPGNTARICAKS